VPLVDASVAALFESQVERTPDAVAVEFEQERLTFGELNGRANCLAHCLRDRGVGPEVLVGLCLWRSLDTVVGVLGILKAGGAYLPLDPLYPRERLAFLVGDAQPPVVVTQQRWLSTLPEGRYTRISLDADGGAIARHRGDNLARLTRPENLVYLMYTSGSTGKPKGVEVVSRGLVNVLLSMREEPGLTAEDSLLAITTLSFDIGTLELLLPLIVGARLIVASREVAGDSAKLADKLAQSRATAMQATPAAWRLLIRAGWRGGALRKAWCGGEALPRALANDLLDRRVSLWNLYGPTETTIYSTGQQILSREGPVPIGKPVANTRAYILDPDLRPVPPGEPGELFLGGAGLARGYLNRPEQTRAQFIPDPFAGEVGARLYRTGDRVRLLPDGSLEYLGRLDHQLKVHGYRIEPGEVEAVLGTYPAVREAQVVAREDTPGEKRLVAYLTTDRAGTLSLPALRSYLLSRLPEYMVPTAFVVLDAFPLTPNGKVDRQALPPPGLGRPDLKTDPVPPRSPCEKALVDIWERLLQIRPIGVRDDFFELGGDSVAAAHMVAQVREAFGREVPLSSLVGAATVEHLAGLLSTGGPAAPPRSLVALQPLGSKPPLFLVHGIGGQILTYTTLPRHLGLDQPLYALQARGVDGTQAPLHRVEDMAAHYLEEARTVTATPVFLGGFSFGGVVAFEMARQLQARGTPPALLVIFDMEVPQLYRRVLNQPRWLIQFAFNAPRWMLQGAPDGPPAERMAYLRRRIGIVRAAIENLMTFSPREPAKLGVEGLPDLSQLPASHRRVWQANHDALNHYVFRPYGGRITVIRGRTQPLIGTFEHDLGWGRLAQGGLDVLVVPGFQCTVFKEPQVGRLAQRLQAALHKGLQSKLGCPRPTPALPNCPT
jgi:amino acid adenylation domain-containing protein